MKLRGILDFSLGNFLCLRGFAPMGVLQDISEPPPDIQRIPQTDRLKEVGNYLSKGELVFFPEIILCACLHEDEISSEATEHLFSGIRVGRSQPKRHFSNGLRLSVSVQRSKSDKDLRVSENLKMGHLTFPDKLEKRFARLDGNHRLSASSTQAVRDRVTPFCLILCQNQTDYRRFSRSLFHNINYRQVPLTMEHNLKLILEDEQLFPDQVLQKEPGFGWPYYHTRKLHGRIDFDLLPNLQPFLRGEPRSFLLDQFESLTDAGVFRLNDNAIPRLKKALVHVNSLFETHPELTESKNRGLLAAMVYFTLKKETPIGSFVTWVLSNHLHLIESSNPSDLIAIFTKVLASRRRTIFVSMPFGKDKPDDHYALIERVAKETSEQHGLKPPLKVERVDWFHDGTSYEIEDKIIEMMSDCGLLIGNLTHCNPNVYHEVGFVMGKAKAEGKDVANMLLFLDESVEDPADKRVGFNLAGIKQLRFTKPETQFAPDLRKNLEKFFKLR